MVDEEENELISKLMQRPEVCHLDSKILFQSMVGVIGVRKLRAVLEHYIEIHEMLMDMAQDADS